MPEMTHEELTNISLHVAMILVTKDTDEGDAYYLRAIDPFIDSPGVLFTFNRYLVAALAAHHRVLSERNPLLRDEIIRSTEEDLEVVEPMPAWYRDAIESR